MEEIKYNNINTLKVFDSAETAKSGLTSGEIGYVKDTGEFLVKKDVGVYSYQNTTDLTGEYEYDPVFRLRNYISSSVIDEKKLREIVEESGLKVTEEIRENNTSHLGWILIDEKYVSGNYLTRSTKISGINSLEEDVDISVWLVERNGYIQLFLTPESIGTRWELEEFRELFTDIFNKYTDYLSNIGSPVDINSPFPDPIDINGISESSPWWQIKDEIKFGGNSSIYSRGDSLITSISSNLSNACNTV